MVSLKLDELNPVQRAAVLAGGGPILILAGAGSGKTRVLTYRIAHLMAECKVPPEEIMAMTFTNKAANEMRERIARLSGSASREPWVTTFHSACARILRREAPELGYSRNFTILDQGDTLAAQRRLIAEAALANSPTPEVLASKIEQAKNEAITPAEFARQATDARDRVAGDLYRLYQERLQEMNAVDFGDLLLLVYHLFERNPQALARWQRRASHLLVDEYQDTNRIQYLLVSLLSRHSRNLCVVGDEDQSIYRWRGADIRNILDFERDFTDASIFKLEQNYRSTKTILAAADAVISNNRERKLKRLWTENDAGEPVVRYTGASERDEADFVAREVARLTADGGFRPADIVIFYRVNAQSRVLEEALVRRRIPYYVAGGVRFYEQREIKDLLAYLRIVVNPADTLSLERLVSVPPRGIGAKTLQAAAELAMRSQITPLEALSRLDETSRVATRIAKQANSLARWLMDLSARVPAMHVRTILDEVIADTGFEAYLVAMSDGAARWQNVEELLSAAAAFDAEGSGGLEQFLERIALVSDADQVSGEQGRVALMTLHTSKGLEYPVVFMVGMEEGLFPHVRSHEGAEIEEERRLCYVGMTRAQKLLYLTDTLSRELYGVRQQSKPSRFIAEISSELIRRLGPWGEQTQVTPATKEPYVDYTESQLEHEEYGGGLGAGTLVMHSIFGRGIVRSREGRGENSKAWIAFEKGGLKLMMLKYAKLRPIAE